MELNWIRGSWCKQLYDRLVQNNKIGEIRIKILEVLEMKNESRKEKWVQINKIQGLEEIREWYWISNSDEDKVMNRNTGKILKIGFDKGGYKIVSLMTKDKKYKNCRVHVLKAKAFLFGPNPLGANIVRHLNDVKTDNRLENLAFGTQSDNMRDCIKNGNFNYEAAVRSGKKTGVKNFAKYTAKNGKINGAKNGKARSKPVRCIETGITYPSCIEAERCTGISNASISLCCNGKNKTAGGFRWEFVDKQ